MMTHRFKISITVGAALVLGGSLPAAESGMAVAGPDDLLELRLAVSDSEVNPVTDSALRLAADLGYFAEYGVEVEIVALTGTPESIAALNSGDVDIADVGVDAALRLEAEGQLDVVGFLSTSLGPPFLIAASEEIETLEDLEGRSYAIADSGSLDDNLTHAVLESLGFDPDGPQYVAIGSPANRVQALAAGQVDATTASYGSFLPVADTPGLHILLPPDEFYAAAPVQGKFTVATAETVEEKAEALQRYTTALVAIARDFDTDPGPWINAMLERRDDLTVESLEATVPYLDGRWCVNGCINPDMLASTVEFLYSTADFEEVPVIPAADIFDEAFVLEAIDILGPYEGGGIDAR